jgi:light-independent protochlorophyllide reductase subunit B
VLGTQMERHTAKRLRIPCAVISAPVHVQDFPARHSPQMGFEGANVLFDSWVHPLVMGLESTSSPCSAKIRNSATMPGQVT